LFYVVCSPWPWTTSSPPPNSNRKPQTRDSTVLLIRTMVMRVCRSLRHSSTVHFLQPFTNSHMHIHLSRTSPVQWLSRFAVGPFLVLRPDREITVQALSLPISGPPTSTEVKQAAHVIESLNEWAGDALSAPISRVSHSRCLKVLTSFLLMLSRNVRTYFSQSHISRFLFWDDIVEYLNLGEIIHRNRS
jgi:hypothetical protein